MKVVVTCGPGVVPIDEVRRITNFSTGELGMTVANAFAAAGHEVTCFRSVASTTALRAADGVAVVPFTTNGDLEAGLADAEVDVLLHTAALSDFEVIELLDDAGNVLSGAKISSRAGGLAIRLGPARKLIHSFRDRFPAAKIVGWKYELEGCRGDVLAVAQRQLAESRTDACVVNGRAYGAGFGLLVASRNLTEFADKADLAQGLLAWAGESPTRG